VSKKYSYIGQSYKQGDSDLELITFCAKARDILRWGGVPSKNERFHGGFQRALSPRYKKIIEFFKYGQASPGSVVVAFREGSLNVNELGMPGSWPQLNKLSVQPRFVHIEFSTENYDDMSLEVLIEKVKNVLDSRLAHDKETLESPEDFEQAESDETVEAIDAESDEEDDLDVGFSKLKSFYEFISSKEDVDAWIERENKKINKNGSKQNDIQESPEDRLRYTLMSLIKPAMIVDGQHRINGANVCDKQPIIFSVCAIKDATWVEQVFQFVVLNKMSKPISKDFLTELLNTSLTNDEIGDIDERLQTIGIHNSDRRIQAAINYDKDSPFYDMLAEANEFSGVDRSGKLSQQGMLKLAKRWRKIAKEKQEIDMFAKHLGVSSTSAAKNQWKDYDVWMKLFFAFWGQLKEQYKDTGVWEKKPKFHLLYIVTLQSLQDLFLESKSAADARFSDLDDFKQQVSDFFRPVPSGFFLNWKETGLQSGQGWSYIKDAVKLFKSGKTLSYVTKNSQLFS